MRFKFLSENELVVNGYRPEEGHVFFNSDRKEWIVFTGEKWERTTQEQVDKWLVYGHDGPVENFDEDGDLE